MANIQPCFENLIGLRGNCEDIIPSSGLYINDIGISLNELNEFVSEDFESGEDLFNTQYNLAVNIISNNIHSFFQDRYKAFSLIENRRVGYYAENNSLTAGQNKLSGILYELDNVNSFISFHINTISLFTNFTGSIPIYVYDVTNGTLLDTINLNSTANQISNVVVNKTYHISANKVNIFVCYDSTGKSFKDCTLTQSAGCVSCSSSKIYRNQYMEAMGGTIPIASDKTRNNFTGINGTAGMSIVHSLNCNHEGWLCSISNLIALPLLYKVASLIVEYGMLITPNEMLTNRSTMNRDLLKERQTMYEQKFADSMNNILNNIELPTDERCFRCRQKSRTAIMLP